MTTASTTTRVKTLSTPQTFAAPVTIGTTSVPEGKVSDFLAGDGLLTLRDLMTFLPTDVTVDDEVAAAFAAIKEQHGKLHVCVNAAGLIDCRPNRLSINGPLLSNG